jgi:hypothetical protein
MSPSHKKNNYSFGKSPRPANESKPKPKPVPSPGQYDVLKNLNAYKPKAAGGGFGKASRNTNFPNMHKNEPPIRLAMATMV